MTESIKNSSYYLWNFKPLHSKAPLIVRLKREYKNSFRIPYYCILCVRNAYEICLESFVEHVWYRLLKFLIVKRGNY